MTTTNLRSHCAAAATLLALAGCSAGIGDATTGDFPSLAPGAAVVTCGSATAATVTLDVTGAVLRQGAPASAPLNQVVVNGTAIGLGAGEGVVVAVLQLGSPCGLVSASAGTLTGGTYVAVADFGLARRFNVVVLATAAVPAEIRCNASGCLESAGAPITGVSNTLEVRLD